MHFFLNIWSQHYSAYAQHEQETVVSQVLLLNKETPSLCQKLQLKTDGPWEETGASCYSPRASRDSCWDAEVNGIYHCGLRGRCGSYLLEFICNRSEIVHIFSPYLTHYAR